MITAVLFDMGGTLDGDGLHWLDRFVAIYRDAGATQPRDAIRAAFDAAERRASTDDRMSTAGLGEMVSRHVAWQFEQLGLSDADLEAQVAARFVHSVRATAAMSRGVLAALFAQGLRLGVVSNGCGNVDVLCREYGYAPFLKAIVDSRRVGVSKPDPEIFALAASRIAASAADTLFVGDSFDRDVVPAKRAGMQTAWLQPDADLEPPDPTFVDFRLNRLADLPSRLNAPARSA